MSSDNTSSITTAVAATVVGAVSGGVFATATHRDLNTYMKFVGVLSMVALIAIGAWVHQTYMKPKPTRAEKAGEPEADITP